MTTSHSVFCQRSDGFILTKNDSQVAQLDKNGMMKSVSYHASDGNCGIYTATLSGSFTTQTITVYLEYYMAGSNGYYLDVYIPDIAFTTTAATEVTSDVFVPSAWRPGSNRTAVTGVCVDGSTYYTAQAVLSTAGAMTFRKIDSTTTFTSGNVCSIFQTKFTFLLTAPTSC